MECNINIRRAVNGWIYEDEKGREFIASTWFDCQKGVSTLFNEVNASSDAQDAQVSHDTQKKVPLAWQSPPEGLTENARERLERAKAE